MSRRRASRRNILKLVAAGVVARLCAPGVVLLTVRAEAQAAGQGASPARRWGLLIDSARCADGCTACVDACSQEHGWPQKVGDDRVPHWIRTLKATDRESGRQIRLPLMCQHCAHPPCADVCPTQATFRRADGIVLVDRHVCIGCRYCVMACPFSARFFVGETVSDQRAHSPRGKGTAEGCTLCVHRIDVGRAPACVEACAKAGGGMVFGDLNDPASALRAALARRPGIRLRSDLALGQSVQYQGLGGEAG
jgi:molybdopterin-containing oxidoreductase family iron-sulfur binding subunit